jgi:hypothetical protein
MLMLEVSLTDQRSARERVKALMIGPVNSRFAPSLAVSAAATQAQ